MQNIKNLMSRFLAIYKKVDFPKLLRPLLLLFGEIGIFHKSDNITLNVLWRSIFMQKIIKNGWTVQKI